MNRVFYLFVLFIFSVGADSPSGFDHQHTLWNEIVRNHVDVDGAISRVDYEAIRRDPGALNQYLKELEAVTRQEYRKWSEPQRLAFLINAYNAFTVKLVIDNYPLDSIRDLGGFFSSPWKVKFFHLLGGKKHLNNVEHDIIRKDFDEPRIHFAVNCAALGCPPLRQEAYVADRLDQQLEDNARVFLSDERRNRYHPESKRLELSSIFKWYGGDFKKGAGSVKAFVASRITSDPHIQEQMRRGNIRVRYLDYDWSLNNQIR